MQSNVPACSRQATEASPAAAEKLSRPAAQSGFAPKFGCRRRKAPHGRPDGRHGGLPMWRAEMTARPNHCFPARPRLCRGRFFDMYPPVVKLRRTFFASFSFFVESNLYEATRGLCKAAAPPHPGHSGPVRHMQASKGLIPASGTPFPRAWGVLPQSIATGRAGGFHLQTEKPG